MADSPYQDIFEQLRDQVADDWLRLNMLETLSRWRRQAQVTIEGA